MKIETHSHPLIAKDSRPKWDDIHFTFKFAKTLGLDTVCVTEHLDAIAYSELIEEIFVKNKFNFKRVNEREELLITEDGLIISSGAEVSLQGGADVGVHATPHVLLALNKTKGFYSVKSLYEHLTELTENFVIVAHHLYRPGKWINDLDKNIMYLDGIEVPAKDPTQQQEYLELARKYNMATLTGSDAHTWIQMGIGGSIIESDNFSIAQFKLALKNKKIHQYILPEAAKLVDMSRFYRKHLMSS